MWSGGVFGAHCSITKHGTLLNLQNENTPVISSPVSVLTLSSQVVR